MDHPTHPADPTATGPASPQELVRHLRGYEGGLPEAVRRPLLAAGATLVPALIMLVEDALADDQRDVGWALLHAMDLLGALGDARALPVLLCCLDVEDDSTCALSRRRRPYGRSAPASSRAVSRRMPPRPGTPSVIGWRAS